MKFAHALGDVSGFAFFITIDEQLQKNNNEAAIFLMQAMLPEGFSFFSQLYSTGYFYFLSRAINDITLTGLTLTTFQNLNKKKIFLGEGYPY